MYWFRYSDDFTGIKQIECLWTWRTCSISLNKSCLQLNVTLLPSVKFEEGEENAEMISYTIIFFLNRGQSKVNVSYSPPSPQTWTPYFLESWKQGKKRKRRKVTGILKLVSKNAHLTYFVLKNIYARNFNSKIDGELQENNCIFLLKICV